MASVQQRNGNGERRVADLVGKRAFLYGRVSSRQQAEEGYSLADQRDLVRAEAERLRVVVAGESFEQGSGQNWELQGFVELEKIVRRGGVDVVIVKNSSRLSRKTTKAAYIEFILERQGARLHYVEQDFDDSAAGRFARNVLRDAAEFYVDLQRELSMAGAARKVTGGEVNGHGPRPYGWQRVCDPRSGRTVGLEHDPAEAAILRRICAELLGRSYAEVCARLNAEGIPPPGKGQSTKRRKRNPVWTVPMMARQLSNPLLWGEYQFRRFRVVERGASKKVVAGDPDEVITVHLPPIVALEEIQRVQAAIAERKSKRRGRIPVEDDPFLLRGLLRCGDCGGALATRTAIVNGTRYRYYLCIRSMPRVARQLKRAEVCPSRQAPAETLETYALRVLYETLLDKDTLRAAIAATRDVENEAARHAMRLDDIETMLTQRKTEHARAVRRLVEVEDGSLDSESLAIVAQEIAQEIKTLEAELLRLREHRPKGIAPGEEAALMAYAAVVRRGFPALTQQERRNICELLGLRAEVRPDPNGVPLGRERFRVRWHGSLWDSVSNPTYFEMLQEPPITTADDFQWYLKEPVRVDAEGNIVAPTGPGLGVEPDPEKLARFRAD